MIDQAGFSVGIDLGGRLVCDENRRIEGESHRKSGARRFAARKLRGECMRPRPQSDQFNELLDTRVVSLASQPHLEVNVLCHVKMWEKITRLEKDAEIRGANTRPHGLGAPGQPIAVHRDIAAVWFV
jgi:hypothetical protein